MKAERVVVDIHMAIEFLKKFLEVEKDLSNYEKGVVWSAIKGLYEANRLVDSYARENARKE